MRGREIPNTARSVSCGSVERSLTISASGAATLDKVSGPVGEALIMTAAGLFVAIPAVLAYNAFVRLNRLELMELDGFAHDLYSFLNNGMKVSNKKEGK